MNSALLLSAAHPLRRVTSWWEPNISLDNQKAVQIVKLMPRNN